VHVLNSLPARFAHVVRELKVAQAIATLRLLPGDLGVSEAAELLTGEMEVKAKVMLVREHPGR